MCGSFFKDKTNIYTELKISTLDRFKNYNKNYKNQQNCWYFINYPKKFGSFCIFF